jgi:hypothetical protein
MNPYKTSALTLISMLALAGCPSDDTDPAGDTDPGTETADPTGDPTTGMTATGTDTVDPDTTSTESDTDDPDTDTDTAADGAAIRVVHASPGAPAVDVYVMDNPDPVITGLESGATSDYLDVPEGDYVFEIRAAGEPADSEPAFATDSLTLAAGDSITAIAAGQLAGEGDAAFRVLALADGFGDAGDGALARIVHAGSDAPAVDIDVGNDGTPELEGVAPYADSGAEGVALPAGEALQVGILADGAPVTAFTTPELPAGAPLYVIATGLLADMPRAETGFSLLAVGPEGSIGFIGQNPRVYALHAGTDAPTVDICAGGAPLLEGVAFGALGGIQVPPGEYALDIHATGDEACAGEPAFTANTPALEAGQQYLAIAAGELATDDGGTGPDPDFTVGFYAEDFSYDPASADASIRVIHTASAPAVTAGALNEDGQIAESLFQTISFPNETGEITLPGGNYVVGLAASRGVVLPTDPLVAYDVAAPAGVSAWVVAHGSLDDTGGDQPFGLSAIVVGPTPWVILPLALSEM